MTTPSKSESFRQKIILLFIDKILFGLVLAAFGFYFSQKLQENGTITDYQKSIFEKRFEAYNKLLRLTKKASDDAAIYYGFTKNVNNDFYWEYRFQKINNALIGGGSSSYLTHSDMLLNIQSVEQARREYIFYLSPTVNKACDHYLKTLMGDFEEKFYEKQEGKQLKKNFYKEAVGRSQDAYRELEELILKSIKMQELILG